MPTTAEKYIEGIGRRKTSVARVRLFSLGKTAGKNTFSVNGKELETYFPNNEMRNIVNQPFSEVDGKFKVSVKVSGGGIHSQAEALRHGIARSLVEYNVTLRKTLKKSGYLKRDPRAKERRKFGLKKARKAPKWSKR